MNYPIFHQDYLNQIYSNDKCEFLQNVSNWCNHRPLLYLAIELSKAGDIIELGCGEGSTQHLHDYALKTQRKLTSYDYNQEWLDKYIHLKNEYHDFVTTQNPFLLSTLMQSLTENRKTTVCLVDHSPGERRWEDIRDIADRVDFVVVHDSELAATGYMLDKIWHLYKYRININTDGACAALLSNTFDVTQFDGMKLGEFTLETRIA